jgi:hypothetical protein
MLVEGSSWGGGALEGGSLRHAGLRGGGALEGDDSQELR